MAVYGGLWAIMGKYGGFSGGSGGFCPSNGRLLDGRTACGRVWARFSRAGGRGGVPLPFFACAQSLRVYPLIVYGGGIWESVVRVSASECAYCIIIRA